jgi:raffinose/stachyose/melibiose transport system substrate-binding protein
MRHARLAISTAAIFTCLLALSLPSAFAGRREAVTLTMLMPTTTQVAQDIVNKNFERVYPNIHIETQYLPASSITNLLLAQLQAGNAPDMFLTRLGNSDVNGVWNLAAAGRLLDLTGRAWQKRMLPSGKALLTYKGRVYGWPLTIYTNSVWYNLDLFKQLGLKVPTQFSDVLALCRKVAAAGKIPFSQSFSDNATGIILGRQRFEQYVYSVDPNWNDKRARKQVTFASSPLWRRALQSIVDMKDAGCFQAGAQGTSRPQSFGIFARGESVMMVGASTELPQITAITPSIQIGMFNLPPDNPKNAVAVAVPGVVISANAATRYPAQVKTFIDFIAREQQDSLFARVAGGLSTLDIKKQNLPGFMKAGLGPLFKAGKIRSGDEASWPSPAIFPQGYTSGILGLFTGQTTVDSILAKMDQLWEAG